MYSVKCECGTELPVEAWSAGTTVDCGCGREVRVPSLHKLQKSAGVRVATAAPEERIPEMLKRGELPGHTCVHCGRTEVPVVSLLAICKESRRVNSVGAFDWLLSIIQALFFLLCGWLILFYREFDTAVRREGTDVAVQRLSAQRVGEIMGSPAPISG